MDMIEVSKLDNGLYKIYWKNGNFSMAAVGKTTIGTTWFAPIDWKEVPSFDWNLVDHIESIETDSEIDFGNFSRNERFSL